jgi:hypothetical protein
MAEWSLPGQAGIRPSAGAERHDEPGPDLDDPKPVSLSSIRGRILPPMGSWPFARARTQRGQFIDIAAASEHRVIESHVADYLNGGEAVSRDNFPKEESTACSIVIETVHGAFIGAQPNLGRTAASGRAVI